MDAIKLKKTYLETKNAAATAKIMGVSHQAVHEKLKKLSRVDSEINAVMLEKKKDSSLNYTECVDCSRPFGITLLYVGRGRCGICSAYSSKKNRGLTRNKFRNLLYPKGCIECGKEIPAGEGRTRGKCPTCYLREIYATSPKRRENQKKHTLAWIKKKYGNIKKYHSIEYLKNKEYYNEYCKQAYIKRNLNEI